MSYKHSLFWVKSQSWENALRHCPYSFYLFWNFPFDFEAPWSSTSKAFLNINFPNFSLEILIRWNAEKKNFLIKKKTFRCSRLHEDHCFLWLSWSEIEEMGGLSSEIIFLLYFSSQKTLEEAFFYFLQKAEGTWAKNQLLEASYKVNTKYSYHSGKKFLLQNQVLRKNCLLDKTLNSLNVFFALSSSSH